MSARILGCILTESRVPFMYRLSSWRSFGARPYTTFQAAESATPKKIEGIKNKLNFNQFKEAQVKSLEEFKKSPAIKQLFKCTEEEKISQAYKDYCQCKYNRYSQSVYGGNPAKMV